MLRIHGLSGEQLGALLRLMADNQGFEDIEAPAAGSETGQGGTGPGQPVPARLGKGGIARRLRLVQG